jgi:hypothetical protein
MKQLLIVAFVSTATFMGAATLASAKNKSMYCMVDKQGNYTSTCFKTMNECLKEAPKKGMTCGKTFE